MPWECQRCKVKIETDDLARCPTCSSPKSNWTLLADKTRSFVVSRVKVEAWRGAGDDPTKLAAKLPPPAVKTDHIVVLKKADVRALAADGLRPAAAQLLFVRLYPGKKAAGLDVALTANFDRQESKELPHFPAFGDKPGADGAVDVPFVFEYGPEPPLEESPFAGVHLVDLTEPGSTASFASSIDAVGLKRPPINLPAAPAELFVYSF